MSLTMFGGIAGISRLLRCSMLADDTNYMDLYGGFLSHGATPSHHPFEIGILHEINHPAIKGVLRIFRTPPKIDAHTLW